MSRLPRILAILALLAAGCSAYDWQHRPAATPLEKAVVFTELDYRGDPHPLSRAPEWKKDPEGTPGAARVPQPAPVDINSAIQIRFDKSLLAVRKADKAVPREDDDLRKRREKLVVLLDAVADAMAARVRNINAQREYLALPAGIRKTSDEGKRLLDAVKERRATESRVLDVMTPFWPEGDEDGNKVRTLWRQDPTLRGFQGYVQEKIDAVDREYRALVRDLELKGVKLRLEAFLEPPKAAPAAVHLPGYDSLEQKGLRAHDRFGLAMSDREREAFNEAAAASAELARAANRVLQGEESVREAFARVSIPAVRDLAAAIADADDLRREFGTRDAFKTLVKIRLKKVETDLRAGAAGLKQDLRNQLGEEGRKAVENALTAGADRLKASLDALKDDEDFTVIFEIAENLKSLRRDLADGSPELILTALETVKLVKAAIDQRGALLKAADDALLAVKGKVEESLKAGLGEAKQALVDAITAEFAASGVGKDLAEIEGLVRRVVNVLAKVKAVADLILGAPPVLSRLRVPETIEVPVDRAPNTQLELQRTSRMLGDGITIRATLLQDNQEVDVSEASFVVREFGWHATLQPGVVLLRPVRMAGEPERFSFAPTVSWLHRWDPRPEETGLCAAFFRTFQPSAGIHAAFVNLFPEKEVEIGLGATLAFGNDIVVLGGGYNVFHEGRRNGDWYYFVGTSLIPILQKIGALPEGGGGTKP